MTLVDYSFYENKYGGKVVDDKAFNMLEWRAENVLNRLTFNHIVAVNGEAGQMVGSNFEAFTDQELDMLRFAVCALIEEMCNLDKAKQQALSGNTDPANVKSRSSGGESISYEKQKTIYDEALIDENKKNELFRNALMEFIHPGTFRHNPFYAGSR